MIPITLNGEPREVAPGSSLADLVAQLAPGPDGPLTLATAVNGDFVGRAQRAQRLLQPQDAVFTFQPIIGG